MKVHESEIADDYPLPAPYQRADEEADELLLFDEDGGAGLAPEDLPRRALANFALYNSEVRSCNHRTWWTVTPRTSHIASSG